MNSLSVTSGVPITSASSSSSAAAARPAVLRPTGAAEVISEIVNEIIGYYREPQAPAAAPAVQQAPELEVGVELQRIFTDIITPVNAQQMEEARVAIAEEVIGPFKQNPQNLQELFKHVKVITMFPFAQVETMRAIMAKLQQLGERKAAVLRASADSLYETVASVIPVKISDEDHTRIVSILTVTHACNRVEELAARLDAITPKIITALVAKYQPAFNEALAAKQAAAAAAVKK